MQEKILDKVTHGYEGMTSLLLSTVILISSLKLKHSKDIQSRCAAVEIIVAYACKFLRTKNVRYRFPYDGA